MNLENINSLITTLQTIQMPATADNMSRMLGCLQVLTQMKEELEGKNADNNAE